MDTIKIGLRGEKTELVTPENTAVAYGSGEIDVYATPAMIGLMEGAAVEAIKAHLPDNFSSVGIKVDIAHIAATPINMHVRAEAEIIDIDGKKLVFTVKAYDNKDKIGEGIHERFVIDKEKFLNKANNK